MTKMKANGHSIEISNPDKQMFPDDNISKKELAEYYSQMAEHIIPLTTDRPMMIHRYPDGINGNNFYQKQTADYFPGWLKEIKVRVKKAGEDSQQMLNCDSEAALIYIANQACITPHIWLSKKNKLDYPDKMIYDLDPPENGFKLVQQAAKDFKKLFDELELHCYVMTTGSRGMHVVLPLDQTADFDQTRQFARDAANLLADTKPDDYTVETLKKKRKGRLFLDYLRNAYGQTSVVPYALRPIKGAPVATPLSWNETGKSALNAQSYKYSNIFQRISRKENPWKDFNQKKNNLDKARKKLDELIKKQENA
ncbi:MAG: non-homologous end-joining DNA ligase [Bacteroidota bacterium]